jgi:hypothetical protein
VPTPEDFAAYKRMRAKGLWPQRIDGSAELEDGATRESLSWGLGLTADEIEEGKEGMLEAEELFDA